MRGELITGSRNSSYFRWERRRADERLPAGRRGLGGRSRNADSLMWMCDEDVASNCTFQGLPPQNSDRIGFRNRSGWPKALFFGAFAPNLAHYRAPEGLIRTGAPLGEGEAAVLLLGKQMIKIRLQSPRQTQMVEHRRLLLKTSLKAFESSFSNAKRVNVE